MNAQENNRAAVLNGEENHLYSLDTSITKGKGSNDKISQQLFTELAIEMYDYQHESREAQSVRELTLLRNKFNSLPEHELIKYHGGNLNIASSTKTEYQNFKPVLHSERTKSAEELIKHLEYNYHNRISEVKEPSYKPSPTSSSSNQIKLTQLDKENLFQRFLSRYLWTQFFLSPSNKYHITVTFLEYASTKSRKILLQRFMEFFNERLFGKRSKQFLEAIIIPEYNNEEKLHFHIIARDETLGLSQQESYKALPDEKNFKKKAASAMYAVRKKYSQDPDVKFSYFWVYVQPYTFNPASLDSNFTTGRLEKYLTKVFENTSLKLQEITDNFAFTTAKNEITQYGMNKSYYQRLNHDWGSNNIGWAYDSSQSC